ncbi:PAS domain S-box protein [Scytonema tolypothrichoides VB-61278]|nr:PAS domain S-box protein [Scytonema tolypothrichoides VB-61278]
MCSSEQDANQLWAVVQASVAINLPLSLEERLQVITDQVRSIMGAHQAMTHLSFQQDWAEPIHAVSVSKKYAAWQTNIGELNYPGLDAPICLLRRSVCMTQKETEVESVWKEPNYNVCTRPPIRGWLAASLIGHNGQYLGIIQVSEKNEGDFTANDEAILLHLAQLASAAIENAKYYHAVEQVQQELYRQLEFTNAITDSLAEGVYALDGSGRITFVNPAAEKMLGWSREELLGQESHTLIHPRRADGTPIQATECQLLAVLNSGETIRSEGDIFTHKDGTLFPVTYTTSPILGNGQVVGAVVAFRNISERKKIEERLRLLESVVVNANDGIVITEAEPINLPGPRILYINEAFSRMTGYSLEEVLGKNPRILQGPKTNRATLDKVRKTLQQWQAGVFELINYRKDGSEFWVEMSIVPVADETGWYSHWISIQRDITERKRVEETLSQLLQREQQARQATEEASRLKDEFLAVVSHELRTPLNSMLGWAKLLRNRSFDEATKARAIETIERNAQAQAQLINDIFDISRIIRGQLQLNCCPVNLVNLIESTMNVVRPAAEAKAIQLKTVLNSSKYLISGDPDRMQQVIWNLLSNAIKFTPNGGQVEICLAEVDTYLEVSVSDNGQGISTEFLPYIFDRFRQADSSNTRKQSGLGLGLAIVRNLVELHGGTICATSLGLGKGSTFTVKLPFLKTTGIAQIAKKTCSSSNSPSLAGIQVLVVDDETDARDLLTIVLQGVGATVTAVGSVSEALNIIELFPPDVIVSDIGMPEENGYSLVQKLRNLETKIGKHIPTAAVTAYARAEDRRQALLAGFEIHLPKPVEPAELIAVVGNLAGRTLR